MIALLSSAAVAVPALIGAFAGTLELPRNDDWSYREIALTLLNNGRLKLDHAAETALVGQIILIQPLLWLSHGEPWAFWVAGSAATALVVTSAYLIARMLLSRPHATLVALTVPLFPGYLAYANSFMTDAPALALSLACLAAGIAGVRAKPVVVPFILLSLVLGCVAFSIRQFALAAPVSVMVALVAAEPHRRRGWIIAAGTAAIMLAVMVWRSSLSGQLGHPASQPDSFYRIVPAFASVGLVVTPAVVLSWGRSTLAWKPLLIGVQMGISLAAFATVQSVVTGAFPSIILDNLASPWGSPTRDYLTGGRPLLFGDTLWLGLGIIALLGLLLLVSLAVDRAISYMSRPDSVVRAVLADLASPKGVLILFTLATSIGLLLFGLQWFLLDRYLWPLVVPVAVLVLSTVPTRPGLPKRFARLVAIVVIAVLGGVSMVFALNSNAFDAAKWRAGRELVAEGIPAGAIDAGYEWLGTYAPGVPVFADRPSRSSGLTWYGDLWPAFRRCGLVASTPLEFPTMVLSRVDDDAYQQMLFFGARQTFYYYVDVDPACRPSPGADSRSAPKRL